MDLAVAFPDYLQRLVVQNLGVRTIDKYRRDGTKMISFFNAQGLVLIGDVDRRGADQWVADLAKTLHPNTRRCRIAMAQGFFGDLHERGEIAVNPFARYPRPKLVRQHRPFCAPHQATAIFAGIQTATFEGARLRLLLMVCYHAGLRLAEVLALDWSDIDLVLGQITLIGKGSQPATMPINSDLAAELGTFFGRWATGTRGSPSAAVFTSRRGNRLRAKDVYPCLTKFNLKGMGQRLWRRSALTNLGNAHVPFHVVSGYARHSSLASITPYMQVTGAQLAQAASVLSAQSPAISPRPSASVHAFVGTALAPSTATTVTTARMGPSLLFPFRRWAA